MLGLHCSTFLQHSLLVFSAEINKRCGPIGILHCLALLARGFEVSIMDTLPKRETFAQWCLQQQVTRFDPARHNGDFDLAMVSASSSEAIRTGEELVRDGGIVYVFAGLDTADRQAMNQDNIFFRDCSECLWRKAHRTDRTCPHPQRLWEPWSRMGKAHHY
jgi:threonine dehydrogenase-like Zn-dependent dehydrogenase